MIWLLAAVAIGVFRTRNWPLVNDGALLHYISFMMDGGNAPYRQLLDPDLPGSFLIDWTAVHVLGSGPMAWRAFDALVLLSISVAMLAILRPYSRFAGIFSGSIFWLLHLRDGMGQTGQRDLIEATLLMAMVAFSFHAVRSDRVWPLILAGLCAGIAVTIKPDSLVLGSILLAFLLEKYKRARRSLATPALLAIAGFLIPVMAVGIYLQREHAIGAFWTAVTEIIPYYASLGRRPLANLLRDWLSAPLRPLVVATVVLALTGRHRWRWEQTVLAAATVWGLASFLFQGKGFPYQRYPSVAFLVVLSSVTYADAFRTPGWPRLLAGTAVLYGALVIAPLCLARAIQSKWNDSLLNSLQSDLTGLGGSRLDGSIQCVDSIVGCNTVLLRLHLHQQTGMLSDFLIFGSETVPAIRYTRERFWHELAVRPPSVIVVTGALHPGGPGDLPYAKLATWPAFAKLLFNRYTLVAERTFAPGMSGPLAYRIYVLRQFRQKDP